MASLLLVAMPFVTSSLLLLVVRPGAPSSVLAPFVAMPFVTIVESMLQEKWRLHEASIRLKGRLSCFRLLDLVDDTDERVSSVHVDLRIQNGLQLEPPRGWESCPALKMKAQSHKTWMLFWSFHVASSRQPSGGFF